MTEAKKRAAYASGEQAGGAGQRGQMVGEPSRTRLNNDTTNQTKGTQLKWFCDVEHRQVKWYWYPYIRIGAITTVTATQGTGKSLLMCKMAAVSSRGERWKLPFHDTWDEFTPFQEPERTLYINAEDEPDEDTIGRLKACGADLPKIAFVEAEAMGINFYDPQIEEWIKEARPTAVIFDPVQQFFSGVDPHGAQLDMNSSSCVRPILTRLKRMARAYECAVILVCHPNKNSFQSALHSTMGSNDFTAAPRSAIYVGRNPQDREQRIIAITKSSNVPDCHQRSLAYRIDFKNGGIIWEGESELQADDINGTRRSSKKAGDADRPKTLKERAKDWLYETIEAAGGCMLRSDVFALAKKEGYTEPTVQSARTACNGLIEATKRGKSKPTYWYTEGHTPLEQAAIDDIPSDE